MNYSNLIKLYINKNNISQGEFGKRSGLERSRVCKILAGKLKPNSVEFVKLEKFFKEQ